MSDCLFEKELVFRCSKWLYPLIGFFGAMLVHAASEKGEWPFAALISSVVLVLFFTMARLKIEIRTSGVTYRSLLGNRSVEFAEIARCYFESPRLNVESAAAFFIQLQDGERIQVALSRFPLRAAAMLLTALEQHNIPIDNPDAGDAEGAFDRIPIVAVQATLDRIRKEQSRLRRQSCSHTAK